MLIGPGELRLQAAVVELRRHLPADPDQGRLPGERAPRHAAAPGDRAPPTTRLGSVASRPRMVTVWPAKSIIGSRPRP